MLTAAAGSYTHHIANGCTGSGFGGNEDPHLPRPER